MPPEQFGGRAVPASDLYGLGATLIALITKQHPADLPQQDLQIEFEQFTQLSRAFTNWLKRMTHPSLERRPASVQIAKEGLASVQIAKEALASVQIAKEGLEKQQQINKYSLPLRQRKTVDTLPLRQGKTVDTFSRFSFMIVQSTCIGTLAIGACAALYLTFLMLALGPFLHNTFLMLGLGEKLGVILVVFFSGGFLGVYGGWPVALVNGIILANVTRLWFYPLTNPKLHRQILTAISIGLCTLTSMAILLPMAEGAVNQDDNPIMSSSEYIILVLAPSLITGLSMGAISQSIARRYQKESEL
jgi:hypothetical protein